VSELTEIIRAARSTRRSGLKRNMYRWATRPSAFWKVNISTIIYQPRDYSLATFRHHIRNRSHRADFCHYSHHRWGFQVLQGIESSDCVPQAFVQVMQRLPLAKDTLRITEERLRKHEANGDSYQAIIPIVKSCKGRAESLAAILQDVARHPRDSGFERYRLAER
jgi:hypothetical protein